MAAQASSCVMSNVKTCYIFLSSLTCGEVRCCQSRPVNWRLGVSRGTEVGQPGSPPASSSRTRTSGSSDSLKHGSIFG